MRARCPWSVLVVLLAAGAAACAASPPLCPDKDACRKNPKCSLVVDTVEDPDCVAQRGCADVAPRPIAPCPKDLPTVALEQFLADPAAHPLPVTLTGVLMPRSPFCYIGGHPLAWPAGRCPASCRSIMALVREPKAGTNLSRGKDLYIRYNYDEYGSGVAVIPPVGARNDGPFLCRGDGSAVCCELPIDGRRVAVTFDRAPPVTREWFNKMHDRDDLTFSALCSLGS